MTQNKSNIQDKKYKNHKPFQMMDYHLILHVLIQSQFSQSHTNKARKVILPQSNIYYIKTSNRVKSPTYHTYIFKTR